MRTATKSAIGILSLGVIAASYTAGTAAQIGFGAATVSETTSAAIEPTPAAPITEVPIAIATEPEADGDSEDDDVVVAPVAPKTTATPVKSTTPTPVATKSTTPTPTPVATKTATPTPTPTKTTTATVAKTGSMVNYKYGTIQLEVVKSGTKINAINLIWGTTSGREYAVVPGMLVTAALSAQGSGFSNISGATFTTTAFKSALDSALAKF